MTTTASASNDGAFVTLEKSHDGNLHIVLTELGFSEAAMFRVIRDQHGIHSALLTLLEDHLETDWEWISPEEISALTAAPILSDDVDRDNHGKITRIGRVYWYPDYAVRDEIEELLHNGVLIFKGID